ncbi:hypothetical protein JTE90_022782 [Oedothorax gibbosus]|uniref:Uncharacterized protein n=1 Tax=Oedothorax gibbosus TaxID=931172 RepID=A0AAV6UB22_9ARAC|nr:hypothetical protein JTE90_022782 [Oedothorax gibbosus]
MSGEYPDSSKPEPPEESHATPLCVMTLLVPSSAHFGPLGLSDSPVLESFGDVHLHLGEHSNPPSLVGEYCGGSRQKSRGNCTPFHCIKGRGEGKSIKVGRELIARAFVFDCHSGA